MGKTLFQKIIESHLLEGRPIPGENVAIKIDQTLTQDATGTMAFLQFETLGLDRVKTELSVSYVDHNTLQEGPENFDDHRYLYSVAQKFGVYYSRAGNGICHQVHLERFGIPGKTLLGADSHTPTGGGIGMVAIGAGGLSVALAMAGRPYYFTYPKITKIVLKGSLSPWVSAKDVILEILRRLTTRGNSDTVQEYCGEGVRTLTVPQRATIANMGAELGVVTSIFPSDEMTRDFLRAQKRERDYIPLAADEDANYDRILELDLSEIEPLAACPHSPDNVSPISKLTDIKVDQVCIGSCTNSSYKDLMTVAKILENKKVHPEVSLVIVPGSRQVLNMIAHSGALQKMISAGARILEPSCSFCIGVGQAPPSKGVSLRTSNRNFKGRSGTLDAEVYLVSAEVACVSALTGKITDPRSLAIDYPEFESPQEFLIDDTMLIPPPKEPTEIKIIRGPNIGEPPKPTVLPDDILGEVVLQLPDNISTDTILPAGEKLKYRSNIKKYANYVFEYVDNTFASRCLKNKEKGVINIIVAGLSYGQGSSREHAAICPEFLGIKVIIAKSFERIHRANLINFGILPLLFKNPLDYEKLKSGDRLRIRNIKERISSNMPLFAEDLSGNNRIELIDNLSEKEKTIVLAGGLLNTVRR